MATDTAAIAGAPRPAQREIPHTVSPGLWTLAWRRLRADKVGMVSLAIVLAFIVMMILSGLGLIASDWQREVGVNYAPPTFLGPEAPATPAPEAVVPRTAAPAGSNYQSKIVDPIGDVIASLKAGKVPGGPLPPETAEEKSVDPLADVMSEIRADKQVEAKAEHRVRLATLPFGGDKWGRDVLKKTIKGSETSIFVGIASAVVATFIGTLLGALAGYYGAKVDDFLNWFYSVFSSMPPLLLILAVAAVLQHKGIVTIILILGLTGWTGVFRLIRAEYLKHKAREYVQAADAIGASNARRMFVHIFPNVSHVVLVQLSILVVGFIKAEVILSFLGFGVPVDVVSWGSMLNEAQNELILGKWWQLVAAGTAMALLVTAFSIFTDSLRDALDPRLKGRTGA
ncbi:MAG: ABC transporter permease subunit [Betaproteobacteria bacterium]|nr:ABC transporter permease subunit [Betaproteobacteria bacterium]